jgi:hypothetical protein
VKANKEVKSSIKADKRKYIDNLAREAEEAAVKGNMRDLFENIKKLVGKYQQTSRPVKDKEGKTLYSIQEQVSRWTEHFKELLNRPVPSDPPAIQAAEEDLSIDCAVSKKDEVKKAILLLRSGIAADPDGIPAEALKADIDTATEILHKLLIKVWGNEKILKEW